MCGEVGIMCIGRNLLINSCGKGNLGRKGEPQRNGARVERKPLTIIHTLTEVQGNPFDLFVNSHFTVSRRNSTEYWGSKEIPAHTRVFNTTNLSRTPLAEDTAQQHMFLESKINLHRSTVYIFLE